MTKDELFTTGSSYAPAHRDDIAGIDSTLDYIDTIIYWLKNSSRFTNYKSRLQPGLLFEGRPGTGKTLCARYIATESGALFINIRDWPIEYTLVTAQDIAEIFQTARSYYAKTSNPVVLFWDEFESYAQDRTTVSITQNSVVSQLTAEMDGVNGKCDGILLVGCTNYKDTIDSALLRPGRMGLHIRFNAPDRNGKIKLLKHYLSKFNIDDDFDYDGASFFFEDIDTAAAVEEAAQRVWLQAIVDSVKTATEPIITSSVANSVLLDRLLGPRPPFMELNHDTYYRVAVHELGHALTAKNLNVPVQIVTIQPGEHSFGRTYLKRPYDKISTVEDIKAQIVCLLGSAYSEELAGLDRSSGVSNDTTQATKLAVDLANSVANLDLTSFNGWEGRSRIGIAMSNATLQHYDECAIEIMGYSQKLARHIISNEGVDNLNFLAHQLVEDKTWTGPQFDQIYDRLN